MPGAARLAAWSAVHNHSTTSLADISITVTQGTGAMFGSGAGLAALAAGSLAFIWEAQNT